MLNSQFWLRPFLTAVFGVVLLSAPANAARDGSTDRPGLDYKTIELSAPNPDLCENACKKDGKCRAWTYSWPGAKGPKAMCALKTGVPPKRSDTCCISGVLSTTSPVTRTDDPAPAPAPKKPETAEKPAAAPKKPAVVAKPEPAPAPAQEKPVVEAEPDPVPAPEKPVVTAEPEPAPEPAPAPEPPAVVEKPKPEEPAETARPAPEDPAPSPPKKPVETVTPLPEDDTVAEPKPAPLPPVDEQDTAAIAPTPRPNPRPLQEDAPEPLQGDEPRREAPPDPAKVAACNDYASRAVAQNAENNRLRCGLSGSRWGFGRNAYYSFCMRNPSSVYNSARAARDRELETCQRQLASRNDDRDEPILPDLDDAEPNDIIADNSRPARFCRNFADQSVRQARQARRYRCGFGGERWSRSRVRQARLCRRIGTRAATQLLNRRARQISNCRAAGRGGGPGRAACREYARTAVSQAREARRLDCGYGGRRWSRNYQRHLRWCNATSRSQVRREFRARERLLDQCY